jgi:hypothetical protein
MESDTKPDLEQDLAAAPWILERVRKNDVYAQNLYAALCNNSWQKNHTWPVLRGDTWRVSWRGSGRVVAELRGSGEYLDWYCSGISADYESGISDGYVSEGTVSEQIEHDMAELGWVVVPDTNASA